MEQIKSVQECIDEMGAKVAESLEASYITIDNITASYATMTSEAPIEIIE